MSPEYDDKMTWDEYFIHIAKTVSLKSKDPSTKVGAIITGPDREIRSTGYNGFPRKVVDNTNHYGDREVKLLYSCHAEENAITNAARHGASLLGCTIYIHGLMPCNVCARMIIQSGIIRVVTDEDKIPDRWLTSMNAAKRMLKQAGVVCDTIYI